MWTGIETHRCTLSPSLNNHFSWWTHTHRHCHCQWLSILNSIKIIFTSDISRPSQSTITQSPSWLITIQWFPKLCIILSYYHGKPTYPTHSYPVQFYLTLPHAPLSSAKSLWHISHNLYTSCLLVSSRILSWLTLTGHRIFKIGKSALAVPSLEASQYLSGVSGHSHVMQRMYDRLTSSSTGRDAGWEGQWLQPCMPCKCNAKPKSHLWLAHSKTSK